jgi:pimeloyl-ACP methyl ester carboxylesterase
LDNSRYYGQIPSISPELGQRRRVELSAGPLHYRECGEGTPIVFLHPMIVNGDMWRKVVPPLAQSHRCIAPDLPLGGHEEPMRADADLSPPGVARIVAELVETLELEDVTLVGNDTGGAFAQIVAAEHPDRLGRLVLVTCDAFDNFPPPAAKPLVWFAHAPGSSRVARILTRSSRVRRSPLCFGWLTKRAFEPEIEESYLAITRGGPGILRDARKALRGLHRRHTLAAAPKLAGFEGPALVVWSTEDHFFPVEHAHRLAKLLPRGRVALLDDCYTFVAEDRPDRLAELVGELAATSARRA